MRNQVLASEIGKVVAESRAEKKWKDLDWSARNGRLELLREKYGCNRYVPNDDSKPNIGLERDGAVSFTLGWAAIGNVDSAKANAFIGQLKNALARLKKASEELKKEYPDVTVKGL
ncbi:MAG: hypothetical protein J6Y62_02080 [Clostridia bacterium]|nr:hypothetical protein [Clostridia bacterium]